MKAVKLPSGNYRVRITITRDGEKRVASFTAPTKSEALRMADQAKGMPWVLMTVEEACDRFLELRTPVLSPATLRGYLGTMKIIRESAIGAVKLEKLNTAMLQKWVNGMNVSKKTKKNHLGFLISALRFNEVDKVFRVRIGDEMKKELYTPTTEEVNAVLDIADPELYLAICFACFGLRRGEICALCGEDIDRERMICKVTKDVVRCPDGTYKKKQPKTMKSIREVEIPLQLIEQLPKSGPIFHSSPDCITNRFAKAVKKAGVTPFRFHDLRSFSASMSMALGASKATVKAEHGWKTDRMLDQKYDRPMRDLRKKDARAKVTFMQNNLHFRNG